MKYETGKPIYILRKFFLECFAAFVGGTYAYTYGFSPRITTPKPYNNSPTVTDINPAISTLLGNITTYVNGVDK